MNRATLRLLFTIPLIAIVLGAIDIFGGHSDWPGPAKTYLDWYTSQPMSGLELLLNRTALVGLFGLALSTVGLLFFWPPARYLYVLSLLVGLLGEAPSTPVLAGGMAHLLDQLGSIAAGAVVGVVFFGSSATHFHGVRGEA